MLWLADIGQDRRIALAVQGSEKTSQHTPALVQHEKKYIR